MDAARAALEALRAAAAPLEPGEAAREALMARAVAHAQSFWTGLAEGPSYRSRDEVFAQRLVPEFAEQGRAPEEALGYLAECVDAPGITTASPRFMGYIPGGGLFHAAMGDFLAAASNKYAGFASAAPGAVRMENALLAWLAEVVGFPAAAAGT
jgi:glutamate/tyrosine decarboxylase-like PLP-dependent enzyme